jgi:lipopolysaccharide biosynthesis regulator YciM
MMNVVKTNTEYLESIVDLQKQRASLEKALNFSQNTLTSELAGPNQKETEEKEKLITLVQNQASQIEAIKLEIENLIRKPTTKTFLKFSATSTLSSSQKVPIPPLPTSVGVERIIEEEEDSVALDGKSAVE